MRNPIIVALDMDDVKTAARLVSRLQPLVGGFKIGPRLTLRADRPFFKDLAQAGIFFFDHKFFDIPSTTVSAVEAAAELGATWVTVHSLCGPECLAALANLEMKLKAGLPDFRILAVTVLTSFNRETLPPVWRSEPVAESVAALAASARKQGLRSLVCSPEEISELKKEDPGVYLVVPGIRPAGSVPDDQKRVATPAEALKRGASALVIGRPIIGDHDPVEAARRLLESLP